MVVYFSKIWADEILDRIDAVIQIMFSPSRSLVNPRMQSMMMMSESNLSIKVFKAFKGEISPQVETSMSTESADVIVGMGLGIGMDREMAFV